MKCPGCQAETPSDAEFCPECGAKLTLLCAQCGTANAPGHKFCKKCGQPLATPVERVTLEPGVPEAERRQLTVMFCDLVGSTPLSEQLDPEDLRQVLRAYQEVCSEVISRFGGHIAQYLGDGLLVYFGYPQAHEDDAQRAVRTGLGIVEGMGRLNMRAEPERRVQLAVRLGIHTGPVVVGEMGAGTRHEQLALGETPNLAARLQGIAEPGMVVISAATHRLVQGLFAYRDLGTHTLKGVSTPVQAYQILGESAARSRLEVAASTGLTPLVGREQEVRLLLERWEQAKDGIGQVVLLNGDAGIGKSRLLEELKDHVKRESLTRWECRCSPYYQHSALYPLIDLSERALEFGRDEPSEEKLQKVERAFGRYGLAQPETLSLWASLLSVPLPARYPPLALAPERQKQKTLEALLGLLLAQAAEQPVLVVLEDLHWVDPSTLEWLALVVDQVPTASVLTVLTFRPDFRPPWADRAHFTHLTVSRFTRKQTELMVNRVTGGKTLPAEVLQQVVAKTDGVPLFVEELTKMVLESGLLREEDGRYALTGPLPSLAIPATLQDSLMARLDRLATVKEVAQLGATLGRAFSYEFLHAVSHLPEATLQRELGRLVEAELLYQRGLPPQATYLFKHALIQEAAYQSLLKSTRQQYHQRIAQVLQERFRETADTQPELLAYHYTEASLTERAIRYWNLAGQKAIKRSANLEAMNHFSKGLSLLRTLPDTPERIQLELELLVALGVPLTATKGWTSTESLEAYTQARELCRRVGETPQLFPVLYGLFGFHFIGGRVHAAHEIAEQFLRVAERQQDSDHLVMGHRMFGATSWFLGELPTARFHVEQAITLYDPKKHRSHIFQYGRDTGVDALVMTAMILWTLGYPDQAKQRSHDGLALARELNHPFTLAIAFTLAANVHQFRREPRLTQEWAEASMRLCAEQGFPYWLAWATMLRGWALFRQRQYDDGIAEMRQGLDAWSAFGELVRSYHLGLLAEAYEETGQIGEALITVDDALDAVEKTGERRWESELHCRKGELLLKHAASNEHQAETCFRQAIDIACRQAAKSLELRAAMSLSRLCKKQGRRAEARQMLAEIYRWFTEGFDTADLKEAKALLEELS